MKIYSNCLLNKYCIPRNSPKKQIVVTNVRIHLNQFIKVFIKNYSRCLKQIYQEEVIHKEHQHIMVKDLKNDNSLPEKHIWMKDIRVEGG